MANFERHKKYLEDMTKCYPNSGDMVKLYSGLIEIWGNSKQDDLSTLFSFERLKKGMYLFDEGKVRETPFGNSGETAVKVFSLIKGQGLKGTETLDDLTSEQAVEVIRMCLSREDRYQNVVIKWILKPSLMETLEEIKIETLLTEDMRMCPLCNAPPGMAIVDTVNSMDKRYLSCCFCGYRWLYNLIGCPSCGNSKPERFSFFAGNSGCEQGSRAVSCDECKTYIKTVFISGRKDGRKINEIDMDIEDVSTIPLDILASERGYIAITQVRQARQKT